MGMPFRPDTSFTRERSAGMSPRSSSSDGRSPRAKRCTISIDFPTSRRVFAICLRKSPGLISAACESAASWTLTPASIWAISSCSWRLICFRSSSWDKKTWCVSRFNSACSSLDSASISRWACSLSRRDASTAFRCAISRSASWFAAASASTRRCASSPRLRAAMLETASRHQFRSPFGRTSEEA